MNVVQLSFFSDPGGLEPRRLLDRWNTLRPGASAVSRRGAHVTVVLPARRTERFVLDGVHYDFGRVFAAVQEARPDVIHAHGFIAPLQICRLGRRFPRTPLIVQDHANTPSRRTLRRRLDRWAFSRVSGVVFTAAEQAAPFVSAGVLPSSTPVFEVPEASSTFTPGDHDEARRRSGIDGDPAVLWVGRLNANKDPLTVLDGVENAIERLPGLRLWCLYHHAPLLQEVRARIARSPRLAERVHLVGEVAPGEVEHFHRAADIFVAASRREGSGFALIEALACGATPVVTAIPSFRKITGDGSVGGLFPPRDAQALARELIRCAGEPPARHTVRRHFERELSWETIGRELRGVYEAVAGMG